MNWKRSFSQTQRRDELVCENGEIIQIGGMTEKPFHLKIKESDLRGDAYGQLCQQYWYL